MPLGGGKYNDECVAALALTRAGACILIVLGGDRGNGLSMAVDANKIRLRPAAVAALLREVASRIERGDLGEPAN